MDAIAAALILLAGTSSTQAQQAAPPPDPRLSGLMIQAQRAQIALLEAALAAAQEDASRRDVALATWFCGWFGEDAASCPKPAGPGVRPKAAQ